MVGRLTTILFSTAPIAGIFVYIYRMDRNRESRAALAWTFILGFLGIIPVLILALLLAPLGLGAHSAFTLTLFAAFALAAIPEETAKLLVIRLFCANRRSFDEPMDGLVYGATAALGFGVLEHVMYIATSGWAVGPLRAFLCIPAHAALGAIIGYSVSRRMFIPESRAKTWRGWAAAVLLHGLYDAFWMFPDYAAAMGTASLFWSELGPILAVAVNVGLIVWAIRAFRRERARQDLAAAGGSSTVFEAPPLRVEQLRSTFGPSQTGGQDVSQSECGGTDINNETTTSSDRPTLP
jgi:RsiW-degrading membrane proteinase PrsW (M82 family)